MGYAIITGLAKRIWLKFKQLRQFEPDYTKINPNTLRVTANSKEV
jgi:hypothetical protein